MKKNIYISYKDIGFSVDEIVKKGNIVWLYNNGVIVTNYLTVINQLEFNFKSETGVYHFKLLDI